METELIYILSGFIVTIIGAVTIYIIRKKGKEDKIDTTDIETVVATATNETKNTIEELKNK
jgi:hypothetical protein